SGSHALLGMGRAMTPPGDESAIGPAIHVSTKCGPSSTTPATRALTSKPAAREPAAGGVFRRGGGAPIAGAMDQRARTAARRHVAMPTEATTWRATHDADVRALARRRLLIAASLF